MEQYYKNVQKKILVEKDIIRSLLKDPKIIGDYYEAILQLRGDTDGAIEFLTDNLSGESIYKIERVKNGIDVYLVDSHTANNVSKQLRKRFNAKTKKSFKLVTRKQGKDIYRSVFVVRI